MLIFRIIRSLWRSGLFRISPFKLLGVLSRWWRCGNSFAALASFSAVRFPNHCALQDEEGALTFAELVAQAEALAATLLNDERLCAGQQVALLCRNHRGFVVALVALTRIGVNTLVLGTHSPARSLQRIFERQRVALVLHDEEFAPLLEECTPGLRHRTVVAMPTGGTRPALPRVRRAGQLVVLTSGSSGVPKGVRRRPTIRSLLPAVAGLLEALPMKMHRPVVLAIPLNVRGNLTGILLVDTTRRDFTAHDQQTLSHWGKQVSGLIERIVRTADPETLMAERQIAEKDENPRDEGPREKDAG